MIWGISIISILMLIILMFLEQSFFNFKGIFIQTIISLILGIIQTTFGKKNFIYSKKPLTLWSFAHFIIPTFIILFFIKIGASILSSVLICLLLIILFEIFEYFGRRLKIQPQFTEESKVNTIMDIILNAGGIFFAIYLL